MEEIKKNGFVLKEARVNFIVHWINDDTKNEVKIVLPELHFEKTNDLNGQNE